MFNWVKAKRMKQRWVLGWVKVTLRHELWDSRSQDMKWLPADCGTFSGKASTQTSRKACRTSVPEWLPGSLVNYWTAYLFWNQVSLPIGCRAWKKNYFKIWLVGGMDVGIFIERQLFQSLPFLPGFGPDKGCVRDYSRGHELKANSG